MSIDKLREIVKGKPIEEIPVSSLFGQQQIIENREYLLDSVGLDPQERWSTWNKEVAETWDFTPDTNKEYWDTFRKLWPGSAADGEEFIKKEVMGSFVGKTHEVQEAEFREKFRFAPESLHSELEEHFLNIKGINDTKYLERSIVLHRLEVDKILRDSIFNLDPQVPTEIHTNEWLRLYREGREDISTNDEGRFTFALDGQRTPAFTLSDDTDKMSAEEQLIYLKYIKPLARKAMQRSVAKSRETFQEGERNTVRLLAEDLLNPAILEEHKINIIIASAKDAEDPIKETQKMVNSIVDDKIKKGGLNSATQASRYYTKLMRGIYSNVQRRVDNGTT